MRLHGYPASMLMFCLIGVSFLPVFPVPLQQQGTTASAPTQQKPAANSQQSGQQRSTDNESGYVLKATTRLVVIDVVATDSKGNAVTDLKAEDFTVLEDGQPQNIRAFGFQQPASGAPDDLPPNIPAHVITNIPRAAPSNTLNVVLLDALNTPNTDQTFVKLEMLRYLENVPKGQGTMIYVLGQRLRLLQDYTTDAEVLKKALHNLGSSTSPLLNDADNPNQAQVLGDGTFDLLSDQLQSSLVQFEAEQVSSQ